MTEKHENLTHEEVWDDSALIDSWNQALDEYKKYHSIHAKGGSVKDLQPKSQVTQSQRLDEQMADPVSGSEETRADQRSPQNHEPSTAPQEPLPAAGSSSSFPVQAVLGSVKDENLKKLLMSWYYAGYYTGLFEGQQQQQANSHDPSKS